MKTNWLLTAVVATATLVLAQEKGQPAPAARPNDILRIVEVKQADVNALVNTLTPVLGGMAAITPDRGKRVIIVRGSAEAVTAIEEAIKRLDVPPPPQPAAVAAPNVELTVQLLYGALKDGTDSVPQDLAATVKQLHALFPYKSYRVLDSFLVRSRDSQNSQTSGTLPGADATYYEFAFRPFVAPGPTPKLVRISNLRLMLRMKICQDTERRQCNLQDSSLTTDLDAREGQKTVVGKSNVSGSDDALILVVTPKVIE